ncbi:MAG: collagen binding domain-containing protein [Anaerolineae bacterium]
MKRRIAQPLIVLPVATVLALTLFVVGLAAQLQPIVPDIGFEIEGNTALDRGGDYDWENAIPPAIRIPDPNSKITTDPTTFKPDSKFDDPAGWSILPGKVGPGQSELINFLVWNIPPGDLADGRPDDYWLVLGMERIKVPGFFELDFEYNQAAWDGSSGGLTRTPGDILVGFELRGKPTSKRAEYKVLLLQYWPGAQPSLCNTTPGPGGEPETVDVGTDPCPPYGDSGWYYRLLADDALSSESGLVQATMNKEAFSPPWPSIDDNGDPCDIIGPYEFAEAAINLTALGIEPDCSSPGSVHAKTRSAPHVCSDLKDLVGPVPVVPDCQLARLDGHKFYDGDGDGIWEQDEDHWPLEGWEIRLGDGSVTHTDAEGYYAFEDLDYGTYTVSEVCPQGEDWVQTRPTPDDPSSCGEAIYTVTLDSCTPEVNGLNFGNQRPPEIRLDGHKFWDGDADGIWEQDEEHWPLEGWEIRLNDGSVTYTDAQGYYAFEDLDYGTYTVSEVCPQGEGWVQTAPELTNEEFCGTAVYTVELNSCTPEFNDLDFGNLRTIPSLLDITKTAQTSFTRTYLWSLDKTVDNSGPILLYPGDYAEVEYQVVAGLDSPAYVDSDWAVEGTITIENLGVAEVPLASVVDVITPDDMSVPVECDEWIVPGLGSVICTYGPVSLPDGSARTNTVTVTAQGSAGEWTATADILFEKPTTEIDEMADVKDSQWGVMGQVGWDETPRIFTYPWKIQATGDTCGLFEVPNTATLTTNDTGTELTADANVQVLEVCPTIAYEDLPLTLSNDWDYNDLVVQVPIYLDVSDDGDLLAASFEVWETTRLTAFTHAFNLQPYAEFFVCSGTYTKKVTVGGVTTTETGEYNPGDNFLLIPDSGSPPDLIELRIDFDVTAPGACPRDFGNPDPINQYHGEWLFFDPWLTVYPLWGWDPYEIHVVQPPAEAEPRILTVPVAWQPPPEKVPVWDVYPCVQEGNPPIFVPYWWNTALCMQ